MVFKPLNTTFFDNQLSIFLNENLKKTTLLAI